ncbi:MAG: hypothetical protein HC799_04410 [Limnothrix sp. RL_2_0]|nr:hypothetical protein [Limnothrix sp. RL_2_0]
MNKNNSSVSTCKNCGCFQSEGRRGGTCGLFNTFADSDWAVCPLAVPIFEEVQEEKRELFLLEKSFSLKIVRDNSKLPVPSNSAYLEAT